MTRVLVIEAAGNLWGSERALLDLLECMSSLNVAVCCPPKKPLNAVLADLHIRILPYYVDNLHEKSRWQRLKAAIEQPNYGYYNFFLQVGVQLLGAYIPFVARATIERNIHVYEYHWAGRSANGVLYEAVRVS